MLRKLPSLGIISGAGPMAGLTLARRLISELQQQGCWQDADFPLFRLINFPFSEMMLDTTNSEIVGAELEQCIDELSFTCDYIIIACQTLHLYLPKTKNEKIINLVELTKAAILDSTTPIVLASYQSTVSRLHEYFFGTKCEYIDPYVSQEYINKILKGETVDLAWIEELAYLNPVVLGCTEYSVALDSSLAPFIDPLMIALNNYLTKLIFSP